MTTSPAPSSMRWRQARTTTGRSCTWGRTRSGNLLEVVAVARDDESELVIHAMRMRRMYEPFLRGKGDVDG